MKITACDVDGRSYWVASLSLGSRLTRYLLDRAKDQSRCPVGMTNLIDEMLEECTTWCVSNCISDYQIDPNCQMEIWFTNPQDATLFKLTYG